MRYHNRTDFRAFDVLADAIQRATPEALDSAIASCSEVAGSATYRPATRLLFKGFANLLRLYRRKYATLPRQSASKAEQRRIEFHQKRAQYHSDAQE